MPGRDPRAWEGGSVFGGALTPSALTSGEQTRAAIHGRRRSRCSGVAVRGLGESSDAWNRRRSTRNGRGPRGRVHVGLTDPRAQGRIASVHRAATNRTRRTPTSSTSSSAAAASRYGPQGSGAPSTADRERAPGAGPGSLGRQWPGPGRRGSRYRCRRLVLGRVRHHEAARLLRDRARRGSVCWTWSS